MGLITGHPRSATVVAVKQSNALMLSKLKFDVLLRKVPDVGLTIYRNVIVILTDRISENNKQIATYQRQMESMKAQLGSEEEPESAPQTVPEEEPSAAAGSESSPAQAENLLGEDVEEQPHESKA
jgi:CRP-like cAMP-binding protein